MTEFSLPDIGPDGFTGAIMAVEGIRDGVVLLNGPTGCKFYHGALSDGQFPRESSMDPLQFSDEFYFGQPRVPATYLDDHDYIFGATEKLEKILPRVAAKKPGLIAVVNSPGAALIGDDLERFIAGAGLKVPCIALESAGFSEGFARGFQKSAMATLKKLNMATGEARGEGVNLIGISVFHRYWEGDIEEIRSLLGLCGIVVNTVLCAGCSVGELESVGSARANIMVCPEYGDTLAPFLEEKFGVPTVKPGAGAPIGFRETCLWIEAVCNDLGADPSPALEEIGRSRKRAYEALSRFNSLTGLPRGSAFALRADGSLALPLTKWLYGYLGMVPMAVGADEITGEQSRELCKYLEEIGCADAWNRDPALCAPDMVFGGGGFIGGFLARGLSVGAVDIAMPGDGRMDIIPRCNLGATGALWLLERIINELADNC